MGYWRWLWEGRHNLFNREIGILFGGLFSIVLLIFGTIFTLNYLTDNEVIIIIGALCIDIPLGLPWIVYLIDEKM